MSRYVVTGAAGFLGSHLVEALLADGHEVVALDAFTDYYDPELKRKNCVGFDVLPVDLVEADLDPLFGGASGIFHLAARPGVRSSWGDDFALYVRDNVLATQRVFETASRTRARVVLASSSSVYGEQQQYPTPEHAPLRPIAPYGVTKLACEQLGSAYTASRGLDVVVLRYFTVYGPRQRPDMAFARLVNAAAQAKPFTLYGGRSTSRSFTYVSDAVDATMLAMSVAPRGAIYNVGGGSEATLGRSIELLEEIAGAKLIVAEAKAPPGDVRRTGADVSRIRRELGWQPRTPLPVGLRAQWESRGEPARSEGLLKAQGRSTRS